MPNRMEYCSVDVNSNKAHRTCRMDEQVYIREKYVVEVTRTKDNTAPDECWIAFPGWAADYSSEVVFSAKDKKPELKYQHWINHGLVEDSDIALQKCWAQQLAEKEGTEVDLIEPVTVTNFDEIAGDAMSGGNLVMIESRMDRVFTPDQLIEIPYAQAGHNYSHNPTHAMRAAYEAVGG